MLRCLCVLLVLLVLSLVPAAGQPVAGEGKLEALHTKAGGTYSGLVLEELPTEVRFRIVQHRPNRPVVLFTTTFPHASVKKLDRLPAKDHEALAERLATLDPTSGVELKLAAFVGSDRKQRLLLGAASLTPLGVSVFVAANRLNDLSYREGWSYESDHFLLVSGASDEIVRRVAVRLEQIYAVYAFHLPPVGRPAKPNTTTSIRLVDSMAEYYDLLRSQGRDIFNLAYYDAARNEIVCAADLEKLNQHLVELRRSQESLHERLKKQQAEINKLPRGEVRDRAQKQLADARLEIAQAQARNAELFHKATAQLFRSLYHEAFHAYLANFVFPSTRGEVPRWLNEGLAQLFEEAMVQGNDLRIGAVPPARLERLQAMFQGKDRIELAELLRSTPAQFVVAHGQDRPTADRNYLVAWAMAHYLMFERHLIGTPAMDEYLTALNGTIDPKTGARLRGTDTVDALVKFVGMPLRDLETELYQYVTTKMAKGQ